MKFFGFAITLMTKLGWCGILRRRHPFLSLSKACSADYIGGEKNSRFTSSRLLVLSQVPLNQRLIHPNSRRLIRCPDDRCAIISSPRPNDTRSTYPSKAPEAPSIQMGHLEIANSSSTRLQIKQYSRPGP